MSHVVLLFFLSARPNFCDEKPAAKVANAVPASEKFERSMGAVVPLVCSSGFAFRASDALSSKCSCDPAAADTAGAWNFPPNSMNACTGVCRLSLKY